MSTNSYPDSPVPGSLETQLGQQHPQEMSLAPDPCTCWEKIQERLSNLPKITWLMRGKAKAGTQIHGPPQTHMPNITLGLGNQKNTTNAPPSRIRSWSGQCSAFWMQVFRRQKPLSSSWDACVDHLLFLTWTPRGSGREKVGFYEREPLLCS